MLGGSNQQSEDDPVIANEEEDGSDKDGEDTEDDEAVSVWGDNMHFWINMMCVCPCCSWSICLGFVAAEAQLQMH